MILAGAWPGTAMATAERASVAGHAARAAGDRHPPTLRWRQPSADRRLAGVVEGRACEVVARDDVALKRVAFFLDDTRVTVDRHAPYRCRIDTRRRSNGPHRLRAVAYDRTGNHRSRTVRVTVSNAVLPPEAPDATAPSVRWIAPAPQQTLVPDVPSSCMAATSDDRGVDRVVFAVDGRPLTTDDAAPFTCELDPGMLGPGEHALTATASDRAGNQASASIRVVVDVEQRTIDPTRMAVPTPAWALEFDGHAGASPDPAVWTFDTGGNWGNGREAQQYTDRPQNASLDGSGSLQITAARETYTGDDDVTREYTSARLHTLGTRIVGYGRLEARIRMPTQVGVVPQFWTVGADAEDVGWPWCGEIDLSEIPGIASDSLFRRTTYMHVHAPTAAGADAAVGRSHIDGNDLDGEYHRYGLNWSPGRLEFTFDGVVRSVVTERDVRDAGGLWVFDKPQFVVLNLAVGTSWTGAPDASSAFPARMLVDWIRYTPAA